MWMVLLSRLYRSILRQLKVLLAHLLFNILALTTKCDDKIFFLSLNLDMVLWNSTPGEFAYINKVN